MSRVQNAVGVLENYVADVAVTMVFGLGYYLFKSLKKKEDKSSWSTPQDNLKNWKGKLEGALERWQYAKTVEEYHELIKSNYEGVKDPFAIINLMNKNGILPTIETYNALLLNCLLTNENASSELLKEEIMDQMGPVTPNKYTLNVLIKGLNSNYKQKLNKIQNENERQSLFSKFDFDLTGIIESLESRNVFMDVIVQNTILQCLVDQGRLNDAWSQYTNMKNCFSPDMYTYTTLLKGIKQTPELSEDWLDRAFLILEEAKSMYELDENFFNSLLDACVNFNRIDKAEELFEEMKEKKGVNEYAYNIMIKGYGKVYNFNKAYEMFENIKKLNIPNTVTYGAILNACVRCKHIDLAESLVQEMTLNKVEKNLYIYSTMINGYKKTKKYDKAIELYEYLLKKINEGKETFQLNTVFFNSILDCCVDCHKYDKLNEIYSFFKDTASSNPELAQLDLITYSIVMKGYAKGNMLTQVNEMYSYLRSRNDFLLDEVVYNTLIDSYVRNNDEQSVLNIYSDMKAKDMKIGVVTYGILIKLYCNMGNCNKAFELFDECVKSGNKPSVVIYQMLIKLQVKSKLIERAITLFRNMICNSVKPDQMIYELIINSCLEQEREKEAVEICTGSVKEGIRLEKFIYDKLAEKIYASDAFTKTNEKMEYTLLFLNTVKENGVVLDRSTLEKFDTILEYTQTRDHNCGYNNRRSFNNYNNNYYQQNGSEEKSIYDISGPTNEYIPNNSAPRRNTVHPTNFVNKPQTHRYSYNNKHNSPYDSPATQRPHYNNKNNHNYPLEEERSIYA